MRKDDSLVMMDYMQCSGEEVFGNSIIVFTASIHGVRGGHWYDFKSCGRGSRTGGSQEYMDDSGAGNGFGDGRAKGLDQITCYFESPGSGVSFGISSGSGQLAFSCEYDGYGYPSQSECRGTGYGNSSGFGTGSGIGLGYGIGYGNC